MEPEHQQLWIIVAELDPSEGSSPDGEAELPVAACVDRESALREIERLQASASWGAGWTFDLAPTPVFGEPSEQLHLVFAEFDGAGSTSDGQYFDALRAFAEQDEAERFAASCRASGEWGQFSDEPRSASGWYVGVERLRLCEAARAQ